ncbi:MULTISPECIES: hypothetical protein [Streptomyces violaceusniger group]|uniref:hypothetical protein n=1 Tax=Streptomyces malaysiensis TaxID=92644 RepID=UPI0011B0C69E|nr:hypothetical protein [Streptomyces malaysiensis]MCQ6248204.1 hypothetical protein [Streptomyces malaysiensis]
MRKWFSGVTATALGLTAMLSMVAAGSAHAEDRISWNYPGYSSSGVNYHDAGRVSFASYGDHFGIYDDAKDGYGLALDVRATKANGTGLSGRHYYYGGGNTSDSSFLNIDLKEGSEVGFRLCMENSGGDVVFACGDWYYTPA